MIIHEELCTCCGERFRVRWENGRPTDLSRLLCNPCTVFFATRIIKK